MYLYYALAFVPCAIAYGENTLGKHIGNANAIWVPVNCALLSPVNHRCEKRHAHVNGEGNIVDRMVFWMHSCRITKLGAASTPKHQITMYWCSCSLALCVNMGNHNKV